MATLTRFLIKMLITFSRLKILGILKQIFLNLHCVAVESGLGQKYAFIKKSTIFIRSLQLRNFDKRRYS